MEKYKGWEVPFPGEVLETVTQNFNKADRSCSCYAMDTGRRYLVSCSTPVYICCKNCLFHRGAERELAAYLSEHGFKVTRKGFERMTNKEKMPEFSTDDGIKIRNMGYYLMGVNRAYKLRGNVRSQTATIIDSLDPADLASLDLDAIEEVYKSKHDQGFDSIRLCRICCGEYTPTWKRPEVKEMTVEEVEKLVGCKVKIVGDRQ